MDDILLVLQLSKLLLLLWLNRPLLLWLNSLLILRLVGTCNVMEDNPGELFGLSYQVISQASLN
jgi:hypothetical protein